MDGHSHVPVRIRRLSGKSPGDHLYCEICCVKWPCLAASEAALRRSLERPKNVSSDGLQAAKGQDYHDRSSPVA
jgi:hypothetical protein